MFVPTHEAAPLSACGRNPAVAPYDEDCVLTTCRSPMSIRASYGKLSPYFKAQAPLFIRGISCTLGYVLFTLVL
ncbi:MAG: hypothetical protein AAGE92_17820, partial [Cyanobacteria bacterium P01_G01_bin.4]